VRGEGSILKDGHLMFDGDYPDPPGMKRKFWTPAERAGLKSMGAGIMAARCFRTDPIILAITNGRPLRREGEEKSPTMRTMMETIRAFVKAARAVKEKP